MLRDALAGDILGGIHEGFVHGKLREAVLPAHLIDEPDHLQTNVHVGGEGLTWIGRRFSGFHGQRQAAGSPGFVGDGDFSRPLRLGHGHPIRQDPLQGDSLRVAGFGGVLRSGRSDNEAAPFACLQGIALVAHTSTFEASFFCLS